MIANATTNGTIAPEVVCPCFAYLPITTMRAIIVLGHALQEKRFVEANRFRSVCQQLKTKSGRRPVDKALKNQTPTTRQTLVNCSSSLFHAAEIMFSMFDIGALGVEIEGHLPRHTALRRLRAASAQPPHRLCHAFPAFVPAHQTLPPRHDPTRRASSLRYPGLGFVR